MTLKLKRTPGLYLVGFMAAGKTTVGAALAAELGWPFTDIDSKIEQREGKAVAQIFAERGEQAFRELEAAALREQVARIERGYPCVVSLGGGASVQPDNWELIANNGITVWLDCPIDRVHQRLIGDTTRPLAHNRAGLAQLLEKRRPFYARADFRVEIDCDDVDAITRRILQLPIF
jgi:shikimate kinase